MIIFAPKSIHTTMLENDLNEIQNLLERKRCYENCIKALKPFTGKKSVFNYKTGQYEMISARCFAHIERSETNNGTYEWGTLDERSEALLLPIFEQLLEEVNQEIAQVQINGVPDEKKHVKTMLSEEIQPMFKMPQKGKEPGVKPSALVKWGVAIAIGFLLLLFMNLLN